jgi:DNA primase
MLSHSEILLSYAKEYGFPLKERRRSLVGKCPECGKEDHLYLFKDKGTGKCFKCQKKYNSLTYLMKITGFSYKRVAELLKLKEPINWDAPFKVEQLELAFSAPVYTPLLNQELKTINMPFNFCKINLDIAKSGMEYLLRRGLTPEQLIKYDFRYSNTMQRAIVPVRWNGNLVGWQGRDITGGAELRYRSSENFPKANILFGYEFLDTSKDYVIISEGIFDSLKMEFLGNSLCAFGKDVTPAQIQLIKELPIDRVYLALDPDAFNVLDDLYSALRPLAVYYMVPPVGRKDFGECNVTEIEGVFKNATQYTLGSSIGNYTLELKF